MAAISDSSVRVRCLAKTVSRRVDEEAEEAILFTKRRATCGYSACIGCNGDLAVGGIRSTGAPEPTSQSIDAGDATAGGESRTAASSAGH